MPAEPRRNSRKVTNEEDIELKRARGEISCAECRRLKLKCDKKLPCGSCVRRGCVTICPNGSLSAGQGTRFILADTDQLHRKITEMSERIRQLEDALAIFQAGVSNERHPLLRDDLLSIKFGPEVRRTIDDENSRNNLAESIDALGTLSIGDHGETTYIGRSGGAESLFMMASNKFQVEIPDIEVPEIDEKLAGFSATFPLTLVHDGVDEVLDQLEAYLPPQPRAWALCEAYVEHFTWWFRPIKRDELIDDILMPIYKAVNEKDPAARRAYRKKSNAEAVDPGRCPHTISALYLVFACASLVDLTLPACSAEAEKWYQLGRAALSLRSIFDSTNIETIQAVSLMAAYHSLCSTRYTIESAWALFALSSKLAQGLGLHRDSSQWNLDIRTVQRRRNLFWEIMLIESIHCMTLGRPPSLSRLHIDCEQPLDEEEQLDDNGNRLAGFWAWKIKHMETVFLPSLSVLLSAKAPNYEVILDLDKKIREASLPNVKLYLSPEEENYGDPALCMKSYLMSQIRSITMIGIHRTFFAQALLDHPTNPLRSPYAPSFLAANRCASVLIKSFLHHFERRPDLCGRFWTIWTHGFVAAIILGATVNRCPSATMSPTCLIELDLACELFKKGAVQNMRARQALPILQRLRDKATYSYQQFRNRHNTPGALDIQITMGPEDSLVPSESIAIFGGQTRKISGKLLNRRQPKKQVNASSPSSSTSPRIGSPSVNGTQGSCSMDSIATRSLSQPRDSPSPSSPSDNSISQELENAFNEVHPSLMDYLSFFPTSSVAVIDTSHPLIDPSTISNAAASSMLNPALSAFNQQHQQQQQQQQQQSSTPMTATMAASQAGNFGLANSSSPALNGFSPQSTSLNLISRPMYAVDMFPVSQMEGMLGMAGIADTLGMGGVKSPVVPSDADFSNLNMGFTRDALLDEQWMDLMRDTGVFAPGFDPLAATNAANNASSAYQTPHNTPRY